MRAKRNQIYIGSLTDPDYYFENDQIISTPSTQAVAIIGQELSIDTFSPVVVESPYAHKDIYHFRSSDGHEIMDSVGQIFAIDITESDESVALLDIEDGTPMWYKHDNELVGKFYVTAVTRQSKDHYEIESVSAIGLLDKMYHGGGLFLSSTFGDVLQHILAAGLHGSGNAVIDYEIDEDVASLPVSGWLPYASKRNNLYQLIFSNGVNIVKNQDGNPRFTFIYTTGETAVPIQDSELFYGGDVEYTKPYSEVSIMEHTYTALTDVEEVVLFDNTDSGQVDSEEIWFDNAPIIVSTLSVDGSLSIDIDPTTLQPKATENSAIISGTGKLTGKPYTHTTRTVTRKNQARTSEKTVSVTECTMVNAINSENLLNRLYAFYCPQNYIKRITNSLKYKDQRCGKAYVFKNPHGETQIGYLVSMDMNASSFRKADCEWYADYVPAGQEGLYQNVKRLPIDLEEPATEGDWVVPEGVTQFKVVIIGGGTGGGSGWPGKNGEDASTYTEVAETDDLSGVWYGAEGGDGGDGGAGGSPGRVKIVTVENAVPGTTYHWTLGEGGDGGESTGFIPDTFAELKSMLQSTEPDITYTDSQITDMVDDEQTLSGWSGSPNAGSAGTASTFGIEGGTVWSSADQDAYVPTGGVYEPIYDDYYALTGNGGIKGGKGGARQIKSGDTFNWVTDGEDVVGDNGETYRGGSTGVMLTTVSGLPEASIKAYGGNGAGAAVGIDRNSHIYINGGSDQETDWYIVEDY